MNMTCMAKCIGCSRLIRCAMCGGSVEALPVLENELFIPDGVPLCLKCATQVAIRENEPHPLTTKHGSSVLQRALQEVLNF
jgi:hypothetical protein